MDCTIALVCMYTYIHAFVSMHLCYKYLRYLSLILDYRDAYFPETALILGTQLT